MICEDPCKNCDRKGLPILFGRYAVSYGAQPARMKILQTLLPRGDLNRSPGDVTLKQCAYNVRLLRAGYLYLRIERAGQPVEWQGYAVHPQGFLTSFDVGFPSSARAQIACKRDLRQANASLVWVSDAKRVTNFHFLFSADLLNPDHLRTEINGRPDTFMQKFDVAAWANGSRSAPDAMQPGQLNSQVVEFAALGSQQIVDTFEGQLYGLMGSTTHERGWGDWVEEVTEDDPVPMPDGTPMTMPATRTLTRKGPSYENAHAERLKQMADFLIAKSGAVVVCNDVFGITQEIGHSFSEAQAFYTHWQLQQAPGHASGVTNEWVYQTAVGATSLHDLVKKNAIQTTEKNIKDWNDRLAQGRVPVVYADAETRDREEARRKAAIARNQQAERENAAKKIDDAFVKLFDSSAASNIIQAQDSAYRSQQSRMAALGLDQNAWLGSSWMESAIRLYSAKDQHLAQAGGGAALSLQLAQCLSGVELNMEGLKLLHQWDVFGDNILAKMISFNNATVRTKLKEVDEAAAKASSLPVADATTDWADTLADKVIKPYAARFGLGDKALGFIDAIPAIGTSAALRKASWPLHVATLMSVKMMQGVNKLPVTAAEAWVVRKVAVVALVTQGTQAYAETKTLARMNEDRVRNAGRMLHAKGLAAANSRARVAAPSARAAALGGIFDVSNALIKGYQLSVKRDARSAVEMIGNLFQGAGSILDWRAKIYEETIFKGIKGADLFTAKAMPEAFDALQASKLRALRMTAFKFLLPAALVSAFWDATDGITSWDRKQKALGVAQFAGALGTVFTLAGVGAAVYAAGAGSAMAFFSGIGAALGLIGAAIAVISIFAVLLLKEDEWILWLKDIPLSQERRGSAPIHRSLLETQQKLSNAMAFAL